MKEEKSIVKLTTVEFSKEEIQELILIVKLKKEEMVHRQNFEKGAWYRDLETKLLEL